MPLEKSGLLYYLDYCSLGTGNYLIHYSFDTNSGNIVPNSATQFPQYSGALSNTGQFWSQSGSGLFTGQIINIPSGYGLGSNIWSHVLIYEKTGSGEGVLVDTSKTGAIQSGYILGINSNNRMFVEGYNENGPFSINSSLIIGTKNLIAFVKNDDLFKFYVYDFNHQTVNSDSFSISSLWYANSNKLILGGQSGAFTFAETTGYKGFIDEYVYFNDAISPTDFQYIASGLVSSYQFVSGIVTTYSGLQITGYSTGVTGVTGITGYQNVVTGSGLDPFGTGNYELYYYSSGVTGYLTSGYVVSPLSGYVNFYITGDPSQTLSPNSGLINSFVFDQFSFLRKIDSNDYVTQISISGLNPNFNKVAGYSDVENLWQLDSVYSDAAVQIYLNGISQISTGYVVTGDSYNSGIILSGQYRLNGFYLDSTGFYESTDSIIYDSYSGNKLSQTGYLHSGAQFSGIASGLVFLNGQLLINNYNYSESGQIITIINNNYSGLSGTINVFPIPSNYRSTGTVITNTTGFAYDNSLVFLNGQRQRQDIDYINNSKWDLLGASGIFDNTTVNIYNNESGYFES